MVDAHLQSPPVGEFDVPPVTLCCATVDDRIVRQAANALVARGHRVELAVGVEADPSVLTRAITAQQGRGLYVLCRSGTLDRAAVDQLREVLRACDVPFGRTLTLAVDAQGARELEERIVSVLRRMVTGRADSRARTWGASTATTPEDDPDTTVRRPTREGEGSQSLGLDFGSSDPYAATQVEGPSITQVDGPPAGGAGAAVEYSGFDRTAVAPAPTAPAPTVPAPTAPAPSAGLAPLSPSTPHPPAPTVTEPGVGMAPSSGAAPYPATGSAPTTPTTGAAADDALSPEVSSAPAVTPSRPGESDPLRSYASTGVDESSSEFEPPLTVGGRMGRALSSPAGLAAVVGGLVVIVLIVVLAGVLGGDDADSTQVAKDEASKAEARSDEAREPGDPRMQGDEDEAEAVEEPSDDAHGADHADSVDDADRAAAAEPDDPSRPATAAVGADEDPPEVVEALENREIRALDIFLVAPERKGTLTYEAGVDYCNELEVAGLGQWRVPTIGELNSVATARMLGKSIYWSATLGDAFGDLMLVLNTKKDRISVVTKGFDGGKVVCIRPRRP